VSSSYGCGGAILPLPVPIEAKYVTTVSTSFMFAFVIIKMLDDSYLSLFYISYEILTKQSFSIISHIYVSVWILYIRKFEQCFCSEASGVLTWNGFVLWLQV